MSVTDLDGSIYRRYTEMVEENPDVTYEQVAERFLAPYEENIPLRTLSPRCFEAAALGTCQILFEGEYNGVLRPDEHYLALRKDFSNFEEVLDRFLDPETRAAVAGRAHRDLIESGRYTYERFIQEVFDPQLVNAGLTPQESPAIAALRASGLRHRRNVQRWRSQLIPWRSRVMSWPWRMVVRMVQFTPKSWRRRVRKLLGMPVTY